MMAVLDQKRGLLKGVDDVDDEGLLVERIGVAGVGVLVGGGLEEADSGKVAGGERVGEVMDVVLVVGGVCGADGGDRGGTGVVRVGGAGVVLEGLVVRE